MLPSLVCLPIGVSTIVSGRPLEESEVASQECDICYEEMGPRENWDVLCVVGHAFHRTCIDRHIRTYGEVGDRCPSGRCALSAPYAEQRAVLVENSEIDQPPDEHIDPEDEEEAFDEALSIVRSDLTIEQSRRRLTSEQSRRRLTRLIDLYPDIVRESDSLLLMEAVWEKHDLPTLESQPLVPSVIDILLDKGALIGLGTLNAAFQQYKDIDPPLRGLDLFKRLLERARLDEGSALLKSEGLSVSISTRGSHANEITLPIIIEYARLYTLELLRLPAGDMYSMRRTATGLLVNMRKGNFGVHAARVVETLAENVFAQIHPSWSAYNSTAPGKRTLSLLDELSTPPSRVS